MTKKKKSKKGRSIVVIAIIGFIVFLLFSGNFSFDLLGGGEEVDQDASQVDSQMSDEELSEIVIEIVDNKILVNEKEVILEDLMTEIGDNGQVVLRAEEAKQIKYDEVKSLLQSNDVIVIEE